MTVLAEGSVTLKLNGGNPSKATNKFHKRSVNKEVITRNDRMSMHIYCSCLFTVRLIHN